MSEVIENFIRKHPELSEREAFDGFLQEERIKSWVGTDETRRERLRKEFGRVWGSLHAAAEMGSPAAGASSARSGPSGPAAVGGGRVVRVQAAEAVEAQETVARVPVVPARMGAPGGVAALGGGRRLQVLCPNCKRVEVWLNDDQTIACRRCGRAYDDMLALVRVTPVGPFEFLFGEGWRGAATAGAILAGLVGLYYLLRWL